MKFGKKKSKKKGKTPGEYDMFGPEPWTRWVKSHKLIIIVVVLILAAGMVYWYMMPAGQGDSATNQAEQRTLQVSLSAALKQNDEQGIINDASQLIKGASDGQFVISKATLAQYHLEKAYAFTALGQNQQSIPDYSSARHLDSSLQLICLQGEAQARFALGERQQLIPMLQEIAQLAKPTDPAHDVNGSARAVVAEYQADIQKLQNGQELQQL